MIVGQVNQECRKPLGGGWHDNVSGERVNCMGELHDNGSCEVARVTLGALLVAGVFFWRRMLMKQQSLGAMCVAVCSSNRWFLLAAMLIKQQSLVAVCVAV